jgi:hypothetical protein
LNASQGSLAIDRVKLIDWDIWFIFIYFEH